MLEHEVGAVSPRALQVQDGADAVVEVTLPLNFFAATAAASLFFQLELLHLGLLFQHERGRAQHEGLLAAVEDEEQRGAQGPAEGRGMRRGVAAVVLRCGFRGGGGCDGDARDLERDRDRHSGVGSSRAPQRGVIVASEEHGRGLGPRRGDAQHDIFDPQENVGERKVQERRVDASGDDAGLPFGFQARGSRSGGKLLDAALKVSGRSVAPGCRELPLPEAARARRRDSCFVTSFY